MNQFIKEACVENLQESLNAENQGADRLELCADLHLGGTTPSKELLREAKQQLHIPLRIMIRPRGGDFVYSDEELQEMRDSIEFCKTLEVEAVVFGVLKKDNHLNMEVIEELTQLAKPLKVVVHKAIDLTPDPLEAVQSLCGMGVDTVLTSGGAATAFEGRECLKQMIDSCGDQLEVMPAGKISDSNLRELHQLLGAKAYHGKLIVGNLGSALDAPEI